MATAVGDAAPSEPGDRKRVVLAGASGAIGLAVCRALLPDHDLTVLTRSPTRAETSDASLPVTWRHCDLFSTEEVEAALRGFDLAVYLVNNLTPSARLNQAACRDLDVLCADNFGRAAAAAGIRQVLYLGVLVPQGDVPRELLRSREEIPEALAQHGTPVTTIRSGLIVARGGTFARMVADLATRPPLVLLPRWASGRKHPVALADVVDAMRLCLDRPETFGRSYDLGGPRTYTVRRMLERTARIMGVRKKVREVPLCPPFLYRWWARFFARDLHPELVRTIVASLPYDAIARENELGRRIAAERRATGRSIWNDVRRSGPGENDDPRLGFRAHDEATRRAARRVRSVQRLDKPQGRDAAWIADHYFRWLPRFLLGAIRTERDDDGGVRMVVRWPRIAIIRLREIRELSRPDRRLYGIEGGALARIVGGGNARLEFREVLDGRHVIAALQDFSPKLPWFLYVPTQAAVHLVTMRAYGRHLARLDAS